LSEFDEPDLRGFKGVAAPQQKNFPLHLKVFELSSEGLSSQAM